MKKKMYTAQEMRVRAAYLEGALADAKTAAMLRQAADMMERETVELAENITMSRMESEINALNLNLNMTKKRLAFAVHLLNETNRVATKLKCWEFPASLKIDIRQFLGKDIKPCEGGAQ